MPVRKLKEAPVLMGISEPWLQLTESLHLVVRDRAGLILHGEPGVGKTALWEYALHLRGQGSYVWIDARHPRSLAEWTRAIQRRQAFFLYHWHEWPPAWMEKALTVLRKTRNGLVWGASLVMMQAEEARQWWQRWQMERLPVYLLHVPPLRERSEDIPVIAQRVLEDTARQYQRPARGFTVEAMERLRLHPWWGNVRELIEVVKQAVFRQSSGLFIELATVQKAIRQAHFISDRADLQAQWETFVSRILRYLFEHPEVGHRIRPWPFILGEVRRLTAQSVLQLLQVREEDAARILGVSLRTLRQYLKQRPDHWV